MYFMKSQTANGEYLESVSTKSGAIDALLVEKDFKDLDKSTLLIGPYGSLSTL